MMVDLVDLNDTDQALVTHLRTLGDEWGPMGVALVAAQMVPDVEVLRSPMAAVVARLRACGAQDRPTGWIVPDIPTTGVHAGQRPAPSYVNLTLWLLLVLAAGCATGAAFALLVRW